ncbi:putative fatty acyl-CoA reductase CG5065 [Venturia canescens]|uniref:putative fatty acyl-CoA reductase CG5065 n=1 Tax=Venturia canescens TaxID=32260 RepID=UPI001C9C178B|nr:putative fatty acyl-CoA reductase CG5065 [Venturia canescens]
MKEYSIERSLDGATVLLTGVTGFVGGALLERMLRLDPGPEKIFVIVRPKRGIEPQSRLKSFLRSPLFGSVKSKSLEKIVVIPGDITSEGLELSDQNRNLLTSTCTHVFHSAALISFAAKLEFAVKINLLGTRYVLQLAKRMTNLRSMIHVSTAYVNCTRNSDEYLEERIYPSRFDPTEFTDMIERMSEEEINSRSEEFLGDHSNAYTFTKNMAENLLQAERGKISLSIIRPSIVLNSWKKPVSGWIDNVKNGACGFIAGAARGIFRTFEADPDARLDIIPVDMVVSTILTASAHATENPGGLTIYHCTSSIENSTSWSEYCTEIVKYSRKHPCNLVAWYPGARPRKNRFRNLAIFYMFHLFPAYVFHFFYQFRRPGRRHVLLAVQQKFAKADAYTRFFAIRQWSFSRRNTVTLEKGLASHERESHPMDPNEIKWNEYFEICVLGLRQYFHKEGATTSERARRRMTGLKIIAAVAPFLTFLFYWHLLLSYFPDLFDVLAAACVAGLLVSFLKWI